jgi:hypothetical protein
MRHRRAFGRRHAVVLGGKPRRPGDRLAVGLAPQGVTLEIAKRTGKEGGFKLTRRRWVIERTFSWLRRNRRLMAHCEALAIIAKSFAKLAMITVMLKRLTEPRPKPAT